MEVAEAIRIIKALADGLDPFTGEAFPPDSPYQQANTVRALYLTIEALDQLDKATSKEKRLPDMPARQQWQSAQAADQSAGPACDADLHLHHVDG